MDVMREAWKPPEPRARAPRGPADDAGAACAEGQGRAAHDPQRREGHELPHGHEAQDPPRARHALRGQGSGVPAEPALVRIGPAVSQRSPRCPPARARAARTTSPRRARSGRCARSGLPPPGRRSGTIRRMDRVTLLADVAGIVSRSHDLDETLGNVVDLVAKRLDADVCSVYLTDTDLRHLTLRATRGLARESIGRVRLAFGEGLVGLAAKSAAPVATDDAPSHPAYRYFPETGEERFHSLPGGAAHRLARRDRRHHGPDREAAPLRHPGRRAPPDLRAAHRAGRHERAAPRARRDDSGEPEPDRRRARELGRAHRRRGAPPGCAAEPRDEGQRDLARRRDRPDLLPRGPARPRPDRVRAEPGRRAGASRSPRGARERAARARRHARRGR